MLRAKSMIKSKTHSLERSPSAEKPPSPPPPPPPPPPRKPPLVEFPTSPQLILGEEIIHSGHPQHLLSKIDLPDLFTCAGCREYGAGKRYTCQLCDFQLHDFCALASPYQVRESHPFHYQHQLFFHSKPVKSGIAKSGCHACGKPIKGYAFRCGTCSFQMHPCCEKLPEDLVFLNHPHTLQLLPSTASSSADPGFICGECRRRRSGRVYRCTACDYHLHVVCAKSIVNGLHDHGIKGIEKPSMFGAAARLASRVVLDFIGGLIQSLGEGVGEALVQNVAKGRCNSSRRREE
ncbi:uncharacterized protein LOC115735928 isoform X2 [Rhodamnia argentea]|uniref:Uncharacterized protein LOC115735928 isoform X2 n=1 Tax=Rhodamnia argentea TaxID=178133 RepID=A0A8B8NLJ3_9MYRT|nr:uncharacterized protein LOC115735928 isoform X2 [Rhodamnia argentea]